jgi:DDE superfamily endonuclease
LIPAFKEHDLRSHPEKRFNKTLAKTRNIVEHASGLLKLRWKILDNTIPSTDIPRINNYIIACFILHNFCIDRDDDFPEEIINEEKFAAVDEAMRNEWNGEGLDGYENLLRLYMNFFANKKCSLYILPFWGGGAPPSPFFAKRSARNILVLRSLPAHTTTDTFDGLG